jgi:hypothetical protein
MVFTRAVILLLLPKRMVWTYGCNNHHVCLSSTHIEGDQVVPLKHMHQLDVSFLPLLTRFPTTRSFGKDKQAGRLPRN